MSEEQLIWLKCAFPALSGGCAVTSKILPISAIIIPKTPPVPYLQQGQKLKPLEVSKDKKRVSKAVEILFNAKSALLHHHKYLRSGLRGRAPTVSQLTLFMLRINWTFTQMHKRAPSTPQLTVL